MTLDQVILFTLLFLVFVFLIWGRWRYDLVAFVALMVALLTGIVPVSQAFSGFGHPATVIIAPGTHRQPRTFQLWRYRGDCSICG